jgi:lysophospholipase L1-like esterase
VQRAFNEFALRQTNGRRRRPVRFVGFTGSPIGTAGTRHMLDGQADTGTVSGRTLVDEAAAVAGRMTSLSNAGRDLKARGGQPDVYLLVLGINDANNLARTAAQMRADIVTIAAAVKAEFPACEVWFAALYAPNVAEYVALKAGIAAALPANVDRVIDFSTWWTPAFHVSAIDGHYTLPATPANLDAWNGPFSMNPAGANYSQHGVCAFAYAVYHALLGERPPLLSGEVAPY